MAILACACILPGLQNKKQKWAIILIVFVASYSLYSILGSSDHLMEYYSSSNQAILEKVQTARPLFAELAKQEIKLRLRLEEEPNDKVAQCKLYNVLSLRALETGDIELSQRYKQQAQSICSNQ